MEGKGIFYYNNGEKYDGDWKENKKEGNGIYYYSNGSIYEGEWKDDKKEGNGTFTYVKKGEISWKNLEETMEDGNIIFFDSTIEKEQLKKENKEWKCIINSNEIALISKIKADFENIKSKNEKDDNKNINMNNNINNINTGKNKYMSSKTLNFSSKNNINPSNPEDYIKNINIDLSENKFKKRYAKLVNKLKNRE